MAELLALAFEVYEYASTALQIYDTAKEVANYISDKVERLFSRTSIDKGYHYEPIQIFTCFKFARLVPQGLAISAFSEGLTLNLSDSNQFNSFLLLLRILTSSARPLGPERFPSNEPQLMITHPDFIRFYVPLLSSIYTREQEVFLSKLRDLMVLISPHHPPDTPLYTRSSFEEKYGLKWTNKYSQSLEASRPRRNSF